MTDIAHPLYVPDTWIPLQEAREKCSLGTEEFDQWIIRALTINPSEAYGTHNTVSKVRRFFYCRLVRSNMFSDLGKI
jgi:adenosine deaminase CECR1